MRFSPTRDASAKAWVAILTLAWLVGCRSAGAPRGSGGGGEEVDLSLAKHSRRADEAFHDGYDDLAVSRYLQALRRAWELDDSEGIANTAFNLAACLAAMREYEPARRALAEARAELRRSGQSEVDAWLLEAKIARGQGRLAEATYLADCVVDPMIRRDPECESRCGDKLRPRLPGGDSARERMRRCGEKVTKLCGHSEPETPPCQSNAVSLTLLRANLFLDQGDVPAARAELAEARLSPLAEQDVATRAEIAAVESRLLLLVDRPRDAANRLDDEARWLRQAGHLRELPMATSSAAEAFLRAGMPLDASDRFFRTARMLYGRDDLMAALYFLQRAGSLAVEFGDADLQSRAALLLEEIERANGKRGSRSTPEPIDDEAGDDATRVPGIQFEGEPKPGGIGPVVAPEPLPPAIEESTNINDLQ
jgi:hypothetical protein